MGKDAEKKEDSGFGFKDKAKAEETIELLKAHEVGYQRLTVRGLLGRAKRVLTLTKAEDKIKNIKEAMEVFEKWLQDYEKEHPPKNKSSSKTEKKKSPSPEDEDEEEDGEKAKKEKDTKSKDEGGSDGVPGLGFKDKDKAIETIKLLEGRDPDYQKLAVKGLIGRAKRVLTCTRDKDKVQNIKDAMDVFEKFLDDFDKMNLSKQNMPYLPLSVVEACQVLIKKHKLSSGKYEDFMEAYKKIGGDYKKLRTVEEKGSGSTWDIIRNKELKDIKKKINDSKLFDDDGNPTRDHLKMIVWAYSPEDHRMKKLKIKDADVEMKDESEKEKKRESSERKNSSDKKKESPERKRKHSTSQSSSESDSDQEESSNKRRK